LVKVPEHYKLECTSLVEIYTADEVDTKLNKGVEDLKKMCAKRTADDNETLRVLTEEERKEIKALVLKELRKELDSLRKELQQQIDALKSRPD